ncbi:hypothetical protein ACM25N_11000 [Roseovarius sp. C7]|uniref:hypothetical protein n=1 Tax=Roseovarius sp. C7 TaxID=3398643 RepID=UPI0039F711F1
MSKPKYHSEEDAIELLHAAAEKGNHSALRRLAGFYKNGKHGFLIDPFKSEDLYASAERQQIELGRAGDHHQLISVATAIYLKGKSSLEAEKLMSEAVAIGNAQKGGLDAVAATSIANYYSLKMLRGDSLAADQRYRWLMYAAQRVPERLQTTFLIDLAQFFGGKNTSALGNEVVIDATLAHALYNVAMTKSATYKSLLQKEFTEIEKSMTRSEISAAVSMARTCKDTPYSLCLQAIEKSYADKIGG